MPHVQCTGPRSLLLSVTERHNVGLLELKKRQAAASGSASSTTERRRATTWKIHRLCLVNHWAVLIYVGKRPCRRPVAVLIKLIQLRIGVLVTGGLRGGCHRPHRASSDYLKINYLNKPAVRKSLVFIYLSIYFHYLMPFLNNTQSHFHVLLTSMTILHEFTQLTSVIAPVCRLWWRNLTGSFHLFITCKSKHSWRCSPVLHKYWWLRCSLRVCLCRGEGAEGGVGCSLHRQIDLA